MGHSATVMTLYTAPPLSWAAGMEVLLSMRPAVRAWLAGQAVASAPGVEGTKRRGVANVLPPPARKPCGRGVESCRRWRPRRGTNDPTSLCPSWWEIVSQHCSALCALRYPRLSGVGSHMAASQGAGDLARRTRFSSCARRLPLNWRPGLGQAPSIAPGIPRTAASDCSWIEPSCGP